MVDKNKTSRRVKNLKNRQKIEWRKHTELVQDERSVHLTPLRAIKFKCLQCRQWNPNKVENCPRTGCAIHSYRLGKDPGRKLTREQAERHTLRLASAGNAIDADVDKHGGAKADSRDRQGVENDDEGG